jgi:hypothetical protein
VGRTWSSKGGYENENVCEEGSDLTVDEFKLVIHEVITEDMDAWRETLEIMADKKLMKQIRQADADWLSGEKISYVEWDDLKNV